MKAPDFTYQRPATLTDALQMLACSEQDIQVLAGGQSLMPMMNFRLATPDQLIDLNAIDELNFIREHNNAIEIGAMTRYSDLLHSPDISQHIPLLSSAIPHIAHSAIRNRGTIGGSAALADPAAEMPALLIALNARLTLVCESGERQLAAEEFFTGIYETLLADNEIIKSITISKNGGCHSFYEVTRRQGDYAIAGVAITGTSIQPLHSLRIAFFGISDCAVRAPQCEQLLEGCNITDSGATEAACASLDDINFIDDVHANSATKKHLAGVVLRRALQQMQNGYQV